MSKFYQLITDALKANNYALYTNVKNAYHILYIVLLSGMRFYMDMVVLMALHQPQIFFLYNTATCRPGCDNGLWSSSSCTAAEKHISGKNVHQRALA